jgi:hypothetical protein
MSQRGRRVDRLRAIRNLTEAADRAVLELALASVTAVQRGVMRQEEALAESREGARNALSEANRLEWLLAEATAEAAGWNRKRLQPLLQSSADAADEAMRKFLISRREHEQAKLIVEDVEKAEQADHDRRSQHASDDWFLSRWTSSSE